MTSTAIPSSLFQVVASATGASNLAVRLFEPAGGTTLILRDGAKAPAAEARLTCLKACIGPLDMTSAA